MPAAPTNALLRPLDLGAMPGRRFRWPKRLSRFWEDPFGDAQVVRKLVPCRPQVARSPLPEADADVPFARRPFLPTPANSPALSWDDQKRLERTKGPTETIRADRALVEGSCLSKGEGRRSIPGRRQGATNQQARTRIASLAEEGNNG